MRSYPLLLERSKRLKLVGVLGVALQMQVSALEQGPTACQERMATDMAVVLHRGFPGLQIIVSQFSF